MKFPTRPLVAATSVLAAAGVVAAGAVAKDAKAAKKESGRSYITILRQAGGKEYAAGYGTDKVFGNTAATYVVKAGAGKTTGTVEIKASRVTLYTSQGTLYGTGSALQNLSTDQVTGGKLNLNHGTGELKGDSFVGTFTGMYRSGLYTFDYKGILK